MEFEFLSPAISEPMRCGIVTARHPRVEAQALFSALETNRIAASLRTTRDGGKWLRFSPHFYNTRAEMDVVAKVLRAEIS